MPEFSFLPSVATAMQIQSSVASPESEVSYERCRDKRSSWFSTTYGFKVFQPVSCGLWVEKTHSIL